MIVYRARAADVNEYCAGPFRDVMIVWNYRNGKLTEPQWLGYFADTNKAARTALAQLDTVIPAVSPNPCARRSGCHV